MSSGAGIQRQLCLIGTPIAKSLSPAMHNAAYAALDVDAVYGLCEVGAEGLAAAVAALRGADYLGANVTIPHKEAVLALLDDISPLAQRAGAVNTIVKAGDRLRGENTDIGGFLWPLQQREVPFANWRVSLLGAGGAARGVAVGLLDAGVSQLTIINRTTARAAVLVEALADARVKLLALDDPWVGGALAAADLLVNAIPPGPTPLDETLLGRLPDQALVYDLAYRRTPLLDAASARGLATLDGLPMLVEQGALALECWFGQAAPREVMWAAAVAARDQQ